MTAGQTFLSDHSGSARDVRRTAMESHRRFRQTLLSATEQVSPTNPHATHSAARLINCQGCGELIIFARNERTGRWNALDPSTKRRHHCGKYDPAVNRPHRAELFPDRKTDPSLGVTIRRGPTPEQKAKLDERKSDFAAALRQAAPARPESATEDETPKEGVQQEHPSLPSQAR